MSNKIDGIRKLSPEELKKSRKIVLDSIEKEDVQKALRIEKNQDTQPKKVDGVFRGTQKIQKNIKPEPLTIKKIPNKNKEPEDKPREISTIPKQRVDGLNVKKAGDRVNSEEAKRLKKLWLAEENNILGELDEMGAGKTAQTRLGAEITQKKEESAKRSEIDRLKEKTKAQNEELRAENERKQTKLKLAKERVIREAEEKKQIERLEMENEKKEKEDKEKKKMQMEKEKAIKDKEEARKLILLEKERAKKEEEERKIKEEKDKIKAAKEEKENREKFKIHKENLKKEKKLAKEKAKQQKIKEKLERKKMRKEKNKLFKNNIKAKAGNFIFTCFRTSKKTFYLFIFFTILFVFLYSVFALLLLKMNLDTKATRYIAKRLPVPAIYANDIIVDYYSYIDIKNNTIKTIEGEEDIDSAVKYNIIKKIIIQGLIKKYGLENGDNFLEKINERMLYDNDVNLVGITRILKINKLISSGEDFIRTATRLGDTLGPLTVTPEDENKLSYYDKLKDLKIGDNSEIIITENGYNIFHVFNKGGSRVDLSYVLVRSVKLEDYVNDALGKIEMWSLVD